MLQALKGLARMAMIIMLGFSGVVAYEYFGDGNPREAIFWMLSAILWMLMLRDSR